VPYLTFIDPFFLMSFTFSRACIVELVTVHQNQERSRPGASGDIGDQISFGMSFA
jgi:hypothetical protein